MPSQLLDSIERESRKQGAVARRAEAVRCRSERRSGPTTPKHSIRRSLPRCHLATIRSCAASACRGTGVAQRMGDRWSRSTDGFCPLAVPRPSAAERAREVSGKIVEVRHKKMFRDQ